MSFGLLLLVVVSSAWGVTALIREYSISRNVMDIPNQRSSHSIPTPRGGGVSIVVCFLSAYTWIFLTEPALLPSTFWAVFCAGILVAALGFLDDHGHIAARWRLMGHFTAAIWSLVSLGGLPSVDVYGNSLALGWVGSALGVVYLVWLLNLYNFMDGIDGLASVEAISVCISACAIYSVSGNFELAIGPLLLSMSALGFLVWNFPKARIFMGDAGSGFLGVVLGIFSIQAANAEARLLWAWLILLGVFIVDATFTLMRRLSRGDRVYEAHRSHAYQYAARTLGMHSRVTLGVLAINVLWLFPVAYAVAVQWLDGITGVGIAYAPLVCLAIKYRAGAIESD